MTVENTNTEISYTGNNSVTVFAYDFLVYSDDHLFVYFDDVEQTVGFTIAGIGEDDGGDITFSIPPESGVEIKFKRIVPFTQLIEYQQYGPFDAKSNERGLDLSAMRDIQMATLLAKNSNTRSIRVGESDPVSDDDLIIEDIPSRANKVLGFDAVGKVISVVIQDSGETNPFEKLPVVSVSAGQTVISTGRTFTDAIVKSSGLDLLETKGAYSVNNPGKGDITFEIPFTGNEDVEIWINSLAVFNTIGKNGYVSYSDFGADMTGVLPADDAIIATHVYANANNLPVKQNNGTVYWLNKTATVRTDTDLKGMTVRMDVDSGTTDLTYAQPVMYKIERKSNPIELDSAILTQLNTTHSDFFKKYSMRLPPDIFSQYIGQMIKIIGTDDDVHRQGNPLSIFKVRQSVTTGRSGQLEQPLYKDLQGTIASVTVYPREDFKLEFKCPKLELDGVASFSFVQCLRSNTKISDLVITEGATWPSNVREVIHLLDCADIYIEEFDALAMPVGAVDAGGVYVITGSGVVRLRCKNLRANSGWGATGFNFIRDVAFDTCAINRIDCHWGAYDVTVTNCRLINFGCLLSGGGTLTIKDSEYYMTGPIPSPFGESIVKALFEARPDYGAEWDGDIVIDNITLVLDPAYIADIGQAHFDIVKMIPSPSNVDFSRPMVHGKNVSISNIFFRMNKTQQDNISDLQLNIVALNYGKVFIGAQDQFYPHTINVSNIGMTEAPEFVKISAYNPPNYFAPTTRALSTAIDVTKGDFNQKITIRDIYAGTRNYTGSRADRGLVQFDSPWDLVTEGTYPNYLTDTQAIRPLIVVDNVQVAELALAVVGNCRIHASTVSKLQTKTNPSGPIFGPDGTQMIIKCYNSDIELTSSLAGSDSFEIPEEVFTFNCNFGDLIKRDGTPNASGVANIFKGKGNTKRATTNWTSTTPYLFDGEDAYLKGAVTPVGAVTPDFIGQDYEDTVLNKLYKATGITSADWLVLN